MEGKRSPSRCPLCVMGNRGYGAEDSGGLSETAESRNVSTYERDLSPEAMETPDAKAAVDEE